MFIPDYLKISDFILSMKVPQIVYFLAWFSSEKQYIIYLAPFDMRQVLRLVLFMMHQAYLLWKWDISLGYKLGKRARLFQNYYKSDSFKIFHTSKN